MARGLTVDMAAAVVAKRVRPITLVALNFAAGPVYFWSGFGNLVWNGITFTGVGTLGNINSIPETSDGSSAGVIFTLSGVPLSVIALAVGQTYRGGLARVWLGAFNLTTSAIISNPYLFFKGSMDVMTIQDSTKSATISLSCENRLIELDRARERRWADFDQQIDYPTDEGFRFVNSLQDMVIYWGDPNGRAPTQPSAGRIGALNP